MIVFVGPHPQLVEWILVLTFRSVLLVRKRDVFIWRGVGRGSSNNLIFSCLVVPVMLSGAETRSENPHTGQGAC